jgi:hypothetical protein
VNLTLFFFTPSFYLAAADNRADKAELARK